MGRAELSPADAAWLARIRGDSGPGADEGDPDEYAPDPDEYPPDAAVSEVPNGHDPDGWPTSPVGGRDELVVDLDQIPNGDDTDDGEQDTEPKRRRFNPAVAAGFVGAAAVATVMTLIAATLSSRDEPAPPAAPSLRARPPLPPAPPSVPPAAVDGPLRFTATSDCDSLPGSTSAQLLADPQSAVPWICASEIPGQVLKIYLDQPYIITAVTIVPGAVNKTNPTDDGDAWLRHRVVTRLQWQFNDRANTIKAQQTGNVHGEAVQSIPSTLASEITVIIQETSRPPKVAAPSTTAPPPPGSDGILGPILGSDSPPQTPAEDPSLLPGQVDRPDPSDGSFAVSSIQIIGHKVL